MYLINWNPEASRIEASFGGCITNGEAEVFVDELRECLAQRQGQKFSLVLDFATTKRLDPNVLETFMTARDASQLAGASKVVFVARDENEASGLTESRLQHVLDGEEEYVSYRYAA
jgi:anti-anti-sigma regulatory factor